MHGPECCANVIADVIIAQLARMSRNQGFCRVSSPGIENQQERKPAKTCVRVPFSKKLGRWSAAIRVVSPLSTRTLDFVGSDPLYLRLCCNQKSFRARITAKPWRCGHHAPTERWPFLETKSAKSFEVWESEYLRKIQDYPVVRLVERVGDGKIHAEIAPLLALHDEIARADCSDLRLA